MLDWVYQFPGWLILDFLTPYSFGLVQADIFMRNIIIGTVSEFNRDVLFLWIAPRDVD